MAVFKIQIPTEVIRNPEISHEAFLIYCKLVQHYYIKKQENLTLEIDHKKFMYFSNIKSNQTLKKGIDQLFKSGLVENKIDTLPRAGNIYIKLSEKYVSNNKEFNFAQLPYYFLDKCMVASIGYEGLRILYYLKSFINKANEFCFCSRERIAEEIGSSPNTIDKYTNRLKKIKLIKIEKHALEKDGYWSEEDEFGNQKETFIKYNNHYYLRFDKFKEVHTKMKDEN